MEDMAKSLVEKISSYNIFNNLFPGIIFCSIVEKTTRFSFSADEIWKSLFLYYFIGMIISRIGSILSKKIFESIKITNKKTKEKEKFLNFAPYGNYIEASEKSSFIKTLNETNNTYRTIIAMLVATIVVKLYDWFLYDLIHGLGVIGKNIVFLVVCFLLTGLFIYSYKKQTDFIRKRVEKHMNSKQTEN